MKKKFKKMKKYENLEVKQKMKITVQNLILVGFLLTKEPRQILVLNLDSSLIFISDFFIRLFFRTKMFFIVFFFVKTATY